MKIGIYGGTFDPPHLGHMEAARAAVAALGLDRLIFVPAKQPPHKPISENSAAPEQRLAMTTLMADGLLLPGVTEVSALELERPGKSYTSDTLRALKERFPQDEFWLLMGTDMFLTIQSWHESGQIMALAGIAAFARAESDSGELLEPRGVISARPAAPVCASSRCLKFMKYPPRRCAGRARGRDFGPRCGAISSARDSTACRGR